MMFQAGTLPVPVKVLFMLLEYNLDQSKEKTLFFDTCFVSLDT